MPEGPFGGPRPLTETQEVWFNTSVSIVRPTHVNIGPDSPEYREGISLYLESINDQQPEIDVVGGSVFIAREEMFELKDGANTFNRPPEDEIKFIIDNIEIDMKMEEPVVVFSHIEDAQKIAENGSRFFRGGDSRVLSKGLLRDQRDREIKEERFDMELPSSTFI